MSARPHASPPPSLPPRGRPWRWPLLALLPLLLLAALGLGTWYSLHTAAGTLWWWDHAVRRLPGVQAGAASGALLGPNARFRIDRLVVEQDGRRLRIEDLTLEGLSLTALQPLSPYAQVDAAQLKVRRLTLETLEPTSSAPPAPAPTQLRLPVALHVETLAIDQLLLPGMRMPLARLRARLTAGPLEHRIDGLRAQWQGVPITGAMALGAEAPLPLQAHLQVHHQDQNGARPEWARGLAIDAQANGTLTRIKLQGHLAMQAQRLTLQAQASPFDALPLPALDAHFEGLNLAVLMAPLLSPDAAAPTTALTGQAHLQLAHDAPLRIRLDAHNAVPGRWDAGHLPLREATLQLQGQDDAWTIDHAALTLASDATSPAGRIDIRGRLVGLTHGHLSRLGGELMLTLDALRLDGLDHRGPPLLLSGPLTLTHTPTKPATALFGTLGIDARLRGALQGRQRSGVPKALREAVQFTLRGQATPEVATLDRFEARAGGARLEAQGSAQRDVNGWHSSGHARLVRFDPAPWLPGDPGATWRQEPSALQGRIDWDTRLAPAPHAHLLHGLLGTVNADITEGSLFAGQALTLRLRARADAAQFGAEGWLSLAGNRIDLDAQLQRNVAGPDRLSLHLDAPALARLTPMSDLISPGPVAGRVRAEVQVEGALGAWLGNVQSLPSLVTRGQFQANGLRWGELQIGAANAEWNATLPGAAADEPLAKTALRVQLDAQALQAMHWVVPRIALHADGSLAEHRASLAMAVQPPSNVDVSAPLTLDTALTGRWRAATDHTASDWQFTLSTVQLQAVPGALHGTLRGLAQRQSDDGGSGAMRPLLSAENLSFSLSHERSHWRLDALPGRADVLGASLRWRELAWSSGDATAPPRIALDAELEPLRVADWLRRLQPDLGWRGDLFVGAKARIQSDPSFRAHIEVARTGGDLEVEEFGVVQPLGLTEAHLGFDAEAGAWRMTQRIVGRQLGRIEGEQTLRTAPTRLWPEADAPIAGQLGIQVEQLGAWGAWVPAGWRLAGRLDATLQVAGRFGAPALIGKAQGRDLGLRNALEGVSLSNGQLDARFEGETATLDHLRFQAGEGQVSIDGDARLGAEPRLALRVQATRATLIGRVDRRVVASGTATLQADRDRLALTGQVRADEGLVDISRSDAPQLGDDVSVRRRTAASSATTPDTAHRSPRALDADLIVDLGPRFVLRGRGLDARLGGQLRFTSPRGRLAAQGEIRTERGTYEAYSQQLSIERGVLTFIGPIENPRLDIEAVRPNTDVRVGVRVSGTAQSPRVRLFSEPDLPATEQLALLLTGRSYDSLGGTDTLLLQRAALALLAGDGSGTGDFNLARALQLDELSVRQSDGVVRDTVVTLGKQISDRLYLGYERGLEAAAGNWQLIYRVAQRFTLRAQSGDDSALDLIWLFRW